MDLCRALGESVKSQLGQADLKVEWVPITAENQLQAVERHEVDASCAAVTVTLKRRELVDFSLPIFPGGAGVVVRSDSPKRLRNILNGEATQYTPTWKAVALNVLREQVFVTFQEDPVGVPLISQIGADNVMWASDYPHPNSTFPDSKRAVDTLAASAGEEIARKVTGGNAARLYRLGGAR